MCKMPLSLTKKTNVLQPTGIKVFNQLIKHHIIKTCVGREIQLQGFLTSLLYGCEWFSRLWYPLDWMQVGPTASSDLVTSGRIKPVIQSVANSLHILKPICGLCMKIRPFK